MDRATAASLVAAGENEQAPKRSPLSRISFGHILMLFAGLLAVLLNLALLRGGDVEKWVAVAAGDLSAGTFVDADDLTYVSAPVEGDLADRFVSEDSVGQLLGLILTRPLGQGDPVFLSDVRPQAAPHAGRAMSVPIDPNQAVAGALQRGDRVDVIQVVGGVAQYVLAGAEVLAVPDTDESGFGSTATSDWSVTIAVDDTAALEVAAATDVGEIHVVRSTGAPAPTSQVADANPVLEESP